MNQMKNQKKSLKKKGIYKRDLTSIDKNTRMTIHKRRITIRNHKNTLHLIIKKKMFNLKINLIQIQISNRSVSQHLIIQIHYKNKIQIKVTKMICKNLLN